MRFKSLYSLWELICCIIRLISLNQKPIFLFNRLRHCRWLTQGAPNVWNIVLADASVRYPKPIRALSSASLVSSRRSSRCSSSRAFRRWSSDQDAICNLRGGLTSDSEGAYLSWDLSDTVLLSDAFGAMPTTRTWPITLNLFILQLRLFDFLESTFLGRTSERSCKVSFVIRSALFSHFLQTRSYAFSSESIQKSSYHEITSQVVSRPPNSPLTFLRSF